MTGDQIVTNLCRNCGGPVRFDDDLPRCMICTQNYVVVTTVDAEPVAVTRSATTVNIELKIGLMGFGEYGYPFKITRPGGGVVDVDVLAYCEHVRSASGKPLRIRVLRAVVDGDLERLAPRVMNEIKREIKAEVEVATERRCYYLDWLQGTPGETLEAKAKRAHIEYHSSLAVDK